MRSLLLGAAVLTGSLVAGAPAASAASLPAEPVVGASGSPPSATVVQTPTPSVTVVGGDTLWGIGVRTGWSWEALAAYNQIPDADLIFPGQVIVLPPDSFAVAAPTPVPLRSVAPTPPPARRSAPAPVASSGGGGVWACIAAHESGGNPATNTGNGYYGAFQDTLSSWRAAGGGPGLPSDYSYGQQLAVNQRIQAQQGWGAWPTTSRMCGA